MPGTGGRHTIFFDGRFWVGVFERWDDTRVETCRVVFGAEPSDQELWLYLRENWHRLRFTPVVGVREERPARRNPQRERREIARELAHHPVGTRSQEALKRQRDQVKTDTRRCSRDARRAEQQERFELKQDKRKQKRRGH
ncbi:MAG: YjdF family protein [Propionibacteriaceae bacterium]|jgi:hypothetical protein|nr:YjdF family protein [Propionibacteriaceae bacterium]